MTNTLKKLEEKGFVDIRADENSGRRKLVTMMNGGAARLEALKSVEPLLAELLTTFSKSDIEASLPFLQKLRIYLDERRYS